MGKDGNQESPMYFPLIFRWTGKNYASLIHGKMAKAGTSHVFPPNFPVNRQELRKSDTWESGQNRDFPCISRLVGWISQYQEQRWWRMSWGQPCYCAHFQRYKESRREGESFFLKRIRAREVRDSFRKLVRARRDHVRLRSSFWT